MSSSGHKYEEAVSLQVVANYTDSWREHNSDVSYS